MLIGWESLTPPGWGTRAYLRFPWCWFDESHWLPLGGTPVHHRLTSSLRHYLPDIADKMCCLKTQNITLNAHCRSWTSNLFVTSLASCAPKWDVCYCIIYMYMLYSTLHKNYHYFVTDTVLCNCMIFQSYINKVQTFYACILHDPQALKLYDYLSFMHCCSLWTISAIYDLWGL